MKGQQTNLQRKRKALLVLPLVVIPFLTMAFWTMGGGKGENENTESKNVGLNLQLPNAQLSDDREKTKLSFYEAEVKVDTGVAERAIDFSFGQREPLSDTKGSAKDGISYDPMPPGFSSKDHNEEKVYLKLAALNKELTRQTSSAKREKTSLSQNRSVSVETEDVDRLAEMMQTVQSKSRPDPELEQLNGMMEKILDIQHPERVKARMGEKVASGGAKELPQMVSRERRATLSCLGTLDDSTSTTHSPFLGLSRQTRSEAENTIEAAVYQTQTIVNGSVITLRILRELTIGQTVVPAGTAVSGICRLNEERLEVDIPSVRVGRLLLPLKMEVYDMDGIRGIYVPGAINRDVAKNAVDNSVQMLEMSSLDPSIERRAASAGIGAVRTLLSRKAKLVRVAVKAGYKVLLKEKTF